MSHPVPTAQQLKFQNWELGLFVHFLLGIFRDPDYRAERDRATPDIFNPTQLDCDQWLAAGKSAGMKYAVFTAKHHDGFCLWPSEVTQDFSVAASPWKDGKGDVVGEFVEACRKHDIAPGIYYSPFDHHCPFYDDEKAYDEYMLTHLRELLGNYGPIDLIWFDGFLSEGHTFDWDRLVKEMRRLQPKLLMFNMGDPDFRWVGNESGVANQPHWNVVEELSTSMASDEKERVTRTWLPAECDARIRYEGWTWKGTSDPLKSVDELMGLYYYSVGRGCNLLLNVGPDQRGLVHEEDAARLGEFGAEIERRFGTPLHETDAIVHESPNVWAWEPGEVTLVDHAIIAEDIAQGEHIRRFRICAHTAPEAKFPVTLYEGTSVGHKAICRFPQIKVQKVYVEVLEAEGDVAMERVAFHRAGG